MLAARGAGVVSTIAIVRFLGIEGLGRFATVVAFVSIVNGLCDFRTVEVIVQNFQQAVMEGTHARAHAILRACLGIDVGTGFAAALLAMVIGAVLDATLWPNPSLFVPLAIFSLSLLVTTTTVAASTVLRVFDRFAVVGLEDGFGGVFRKVLVIVAAWRFQTLDAVMWAFVAGSLVQALVLNGLAWRTVHRRVPLDGTQHVLDRAERRDIVRFLIGSNLLSGAARIGDQLDLFAVSLLMAPQLIGIYKIAVTVREVATALATPLNRLAYPRISRAVIAGGHALRSEIRTLSVLSSVGGIGVGAVLFVGAGRLASVLADGEPVGEAPTLIRIMVLGTTVAAVVFWPGFVLLAHRRTSELARAVAAIAIGSGLVLALIVPTFGLAGAAWTFCVSIWTRTAVQWQMTRRSSVSGGTGGDTIRGAGLAGSARR